MLKRSSPIVWRRSDERACVRACASFFASIISCSQAMGKWTSRDHGWWRVALRNGLSKFVCLHSDRTIFGVGLELMGIERDGSWLNTN